MSSLRLYSGICPKGQREMANVFRIAVFRSRFDPITSLTQVYSATVTPACSEVVTVIAINTVVVMPSDYLTGVCYFLRGYIFLTQETC
jgi:hypothetical protein